jgi:hypothetical protein
VLTGDIHTSWANDLSPDPYNPLVAPIGVEMVCSSVTSSGFESILGSIEVARLAEPVVQLVNPHIKWTDLTRRGYLLLDVTPDRVQGEWYLFETVATRNLDGTFRTAWQTRSGANRLTAGTGPLAPGVAAPATPPLTVEPADATGDAPPAAPSGASGATTSLPATGPSGPSPRAGAAVLGAAVVVEAIRRRAAAAATAPPVDGDP